MDAEMKSTLKMYKERGFAGRMAFGASPALLVVDMTNGFTDPESPLGSDLSPQIEALQPLLEAFRGRELPIFFTTNLYDPAHPGGAMFVGKVPAIKVLVPGSAAVEVDQRIRPRPGETVVEKKLPSAFFGTNLNDELRRKGVDTVVITGCSTSGCIRASVNDSMSYGFHTIVVREAVGDRAKAPHEANLFDIDAKLGDVVSLADALEYLARLVPERAAVMAVPG